MVRNVYYPKPVKIAFNLNFKKTNISAFILSKAEFGLKL